MALVLVADDDAANRSLVVTLLGYTGHQVLAAADGGEALASARVHRPDLVITDLLMPVMDGYEFVRELRSDPELAATPVIFYTANYLQDEVRPIADALGVTELVAKPIDPQHFLRLVEQSIGSRPVVPLVPTDTFDQAHRRALSANLFTKVQELAHVEDALMASEARVAEAQQERAALEERLRISDRLDSLGQLAAGIAHDFNNLLAVILNFSQFVGEGLNDLAATPHDPDHPLWDQLREDVKAIEGAADRAAQLTRQLLIFARRDVAHAEIVDVNSLVTSTADLLRRTIGEHIHIEVALAAGHPSALLDPTQLEQVLVNLVLNARDAIGNAGTVLISTRTAPLDERAAAGCGVQPGDYLILSVADDGSGMPPDVAARAFEPFFSTKPAGRGTGLGLSTVYGIVTGLGGSVNIDSRIGAGTRIEVYIPAAPRSAPTEERRPAAAGRTATTSRRRSVLLAEDDDEVRGVTERILADAGYEVLAVSGGASALALVGDPARTFDVLLTDIVMPQMSGIQLAEQALAIRPDLPVLFMSGYADGLGAAQSPLTADIVLLEKPFSRESLVETLARLLGDGQPPQDGGEHRNGADVHACAP